ncbi:hypothetical protein C1637_14030 [Chryseobacterium lactis]|uniref:GH26 domain-containing protein n=1 Tax=Chryseobacterium lactis TaxID=1241981 RepID=A0A3G6RH74_CHRLC|nr:hypothetical protein [Chryseobacterium lactis]AZA83760.1 hypothetical protein EG342_18535 [Chryseobacterium lactis]AZB04145.1 hypothetical protein EG341_09410 [Chryseobacterium lactis]PNW12946.1 hypothetical protein C1637_14030 [Chryseobacterium lactis]
MKRMIGRLGLALLVFGFCFFKGQTPQNYIYTSSGDLQEIEKMITRKDVGGVQIVYNWRALETSKDVYDFSVIEKDLQYLTSLHKKLFIQLQDRFFEPQARYIPDYVLNEKEYTGGLVAQYDNPGENKPVGSGWVTQQWNPAVRMRYQKLIGELAKKFDGKIQGINLPETSIDIDMKKDKTNFSCDRYFQAELDNLKFAKSVFHQSYVLQYVNFFPCEWENDHQYMSRLFDFADKNNIGLGGPDIVPDKKAQMKNSYPFFNKYKGKLSLVAMAVQEPTLTYTNPKTKKPFTKEEFVSYAQDYLGVNIIFWSVESPWLRDPKID